MWENTNRVRIGRDRQLEIPRRNAPSWAKAGNAYFAPLCFKRPLLVDEGDWLYVWTVFPNIEAIDDWDIDPRNKPDLCFDISVGVESKTKGKSTVRWFFTIPREIVTSGWLPGAGEPVIRDISEDEINFWTPRVYNIERCRE